MLSKGCVARVATHAPSPHVVANWRVLVMTLVTSHCGVLWCVVLAPVADDDARHVTLWCVVLAPVADDHSVAAHFFL